MFEKEDKHVNTTESIALFFELMNTMAISNDEPVTPFYKENLLTLDIL